MTLEELQARRAKLRENSDKTLRNMDKIIAEDRRVTDVAHNSREILDDLDREFEEATGLQGNDIKFLFTATGLQLARIAFVNELTKIEKAGQGNRKEEYLHDFQDKLLRKFNNNGSVIDKPYYASMEHIIVQRGVPYDATAQLTEKSIESLLNKDRSWSMDFTSYIPDEKLHLFDGANHRFATLGHDPVIGLFVGTCNIMTNTITCVKRPMFSTDISIPVLTTNHVIYTDDYKDPRIATYAGTTVMITKSVERIKNEPAALAASLIKQIIHIGTDMYTPCGIQIPAANLILSNSQVEKMTKYISTGDVIKIGASAGIAELINTIIATVHTLMYDPASKYSRDVYNVRTRKIITYSNAIATGSNVIWVGANVALGRTEAIKQLDIGGLIVLVKRLISDKEYIRKIKEEFVFGQFNKMIQGEDLNLEKVSWD